MGTISSDEKKKQKDRGDRLESEKKSCLFLCDLIDCFVFFKFCAQKHKTRTHTIETSHQNK